MTFRLLPIVLLSAAVIAQASAQDSSSCAVEFFPGSAIFPVWHADALHHGISLSKVTENSDWIGTIGGAIPLVQATLSGRPVQWSVAVSTFNRLIKTPGHLTVYTIDYRVDFPLDVRSGLWGVRCGPGHISCHFADDGLEIVGRRSIQSIRDYVAAAVSCDLPVFCGFVYAGAQYNYHIVPVREKKWQLQCGAEAGDFPITSWAAAYASFDIKIREDVAWGSTQSYQVGLRMAARDRYALRMAYTHRTGMEERGQLFTERATVNLVSVELEF